MEQVLVFALGEERYGLEISHIQEVVEAPELCFIPRASELFLGALNFHSQVMPVLDTARFLDLGDCREQRDVRVIALSRAHCRLALAVPKVLGVVPLVQDALLPENEDRRAKTYIRAVQSRGEEMINLLDLDRLLAALSAMNEETGGKRGA